MQDSEPQDQSSSTDDDKSQIHIDLSGRHRKCRLTAGKRRTSSSRNKLLITSCKPSTPIPSLPPCPELLRINSVGIAPPDLRQQKRKQRTQETTRHKDPKHIRRPNRVRQRIKHQRRDDRADFPACRREAMRERLEACGEDLGGVAVRRRVRAEVEEELEEGEADDEGNCSEAVESPREDADCS